MAEEIITEQNQVNDPNAQNTRQKAPNNNENSAPQTETPALPVNWEEKIKEDPSLQSFIERHTKKSNETAVQNALRKQQRLTDEKLSESERLQAMSDSEKAVYWQRKAEAAEQSRIRDREMDKLKAQTEAMLMEKRIPTVFLSVFDFDNATAEEITQRVNMLSEYEYYGKGELEKRVAAAVDEKLKQKTPENYTGNNQTQKTYATMRFF